MLYVCPEIINAPIPVYRADGSLYAIVSEQCLARLQSAGLVARVVRHRKGHINRAILFLRPDEPTPVSASSVMGTKYSFKRLLEHGLAWDLKHLGGNRNGKTYAPPETRANFLQVVADCLAPWKVGGQLTGACLARAREARSVAARRGRCDLFQ